MKFRKAATVLLAAALACTLTVTPVLADEVDDLKQQKEDVQSEVEDLQSQLNTLMQKMSDLEDELISTGQEITQTEEDLKQAEEDEQEQYEAMKLRIKYMYEAGTGSADLEKVLSSGDMSGMLSQAEYSQQVHNYDREKLEEYVATTEKVKELKTSLEEKQDDLEAAQESADYLLYDEPLGLVSGVQTQLPVILSEYQFYDRGDVEDYLKLMQSTPDYIDSLIQFERQKSEAGLFMADYAADTVIEQCSAFLEMGDGNYLYSTFSDRIAGLDELTEEEKSDYIEDNALMMEDYVYPAYQALLAAVEELKGTGQNEKGLCYLPEGKAYYEMVVRQSTGTEQTVRELEDLARR